MFLSDLWRTSRDHIYRTLSPECICEGLRPELRSRDQLNRDYLLLTCVRTWPALDRPSELKYQFLIREWSTDFFMWWTSWRVQGIHMESYWITVSYHKKFVGYMWISVMQSRLNHLSIRWIFPKLLLNHWRWKWNDQLITHNWRWWC